MKYRLTGLEAFYIIPLLPRRAELIILRFCFEIVCRLDLRKRWFIQPNTLLLLNPYPPDTNNFINAFIELLEVAMSDATIYIAVSLFGFLATSLWVLLSRKLVIMIIAIGIGSVVLSMLFFLMGAPFAGAFELSVGAGLISILFVIATSLSGKKNDKGGA